MTYNLRKAYRYFLSIVSIQT